MKLSVNELKRNHIVHVIRDGEGHYSVIREITNESVYLADPSLGNIVMTREEFSEIYTGNALVITDPKLAVLPVDSSIQTNETSEQTNNTTSTVQPENLTVGEMQSIQGKVIKGGVVAAIVIGKLKAAGVPITITTIKAGTWLMLAGLPITVKNVKVATILMRAGKPVTRVTVRAVIRAWPIIRGALIVAGIKVTAWALENAAWSWVQGNCIISGRRTPDGHFGDVFCRICARRFGQVWAGRP